MTAGDVAYGIRHRQYGQAESERYTRETNANIWKGSSHNRTTTTAENKPERADEFSAILFHSFRKLLARGLSRATLLP